MSIAYIILAGTLQKHAGPFVCAVQNRKYRRMLPCRIEAESNTICLLLHINYHMDIKRKGFAGCGRRQARNFGRCTRIKKLCQAKDAGSLVCPAKPGGALFCAVYGQKIVYNLLFLFFEIQFVYKTAQNISAFPRKWERRFFFCRGNRRCRR